jgi:hypothetical protein
MPDLDALTAAAFTRHLHTIFRLQTGGEPLPLELVEVQRASYADDPAAVGPAGRREPFNLLFRGPRSPYARQGTHRLEHDEIGTLEIFLVPVGPDAAGMRYEAIFT